MDPGSNPSVAERGFQESLELILTWLLEAKDSLARQDPVSSDVQTVKEQFQEHEVCHGSYFIRLISNLIRDSGSG